MLGYIAKFAYQYLFYQGSQRWSREQLAAWQDERLRRIVRHAGKQVPYYRALFREIGLNPDAFRGREDLHHIPYLDKETVRTRREDLIAENAAKFGVNWESTSGSTGTPLHIIIDRSTQANKLGALLRSYQWAGYKIGRKTFSLQSYYLKAAHFEYKPAFRVLRFDSNQLKKEAALEIIAEINRIKPKFFMGFPFDLLMLSQFAAEEGILIAAPNSMITYGETLSEYKRKALETVYRCPVFDYYSHHEAVVMVAECEHRQKHLIDDFSYHEIVDKDGSRGELVGTGYHNYAMPLIRYRTLDDVTVDPAVSRCECGRPFRVIKEIAGKQCDYIETPDGRFLGAVMSHSIDNGRGVIMSQCIQDAIDHIDVNLVVDESYNEESERNLERDLRKRLGNEMRIDFRIVPQLEKRPGGKTPFILSKIGHKYA